MKNTLAKRNQAALKLNARWQQGTVHFEYIAVR